VTQATLRRISPRPPPPHGFPVPEALLAGDREDGHERYRREGDHICLDLRLRSPRQLFDSRDPAPFRDRDLDPEAEAYFLEALEELPRKVSVKLVLHFAEPEEPGLGSAEITASLQAHMVHEEEEAGRRLRRFIRQAQVGAVAALAVLLGCLFLSGWPHRPGSRCAPR